MKRTVILGDRTVTRRKVDDLAHWLAPRAITRYAVSIGGRLFPPKQLAYWLAGRHIGSTQSRQAFEALGYRIGVITFDTRQHTERLSRTAKRANTIRRLRLVRGGRAS